MPWAGDMCRQAPRVENGSPTHDCPSCRRLPIRVSTPVAAAIALGTEDGDTAAGAFELSVPQAGGGTRYLGHREFARYYRQRYKPDRKAALTAAAKVLAEYRRMAVPLLVRRRERDGGRGGGWAAREGSQFPAADRPVERGPGECWLCEPASVPAAGYAVRGLTPRGVPPLRADGPDDGTDGETTGSKGCAAALVPESAVLGHGEEHQRQAAQERPVLSAACSGCSPAICRVPHFPSAGFDSRQALPADLRRAAVRRERHL